MGFKKTSDGRVFFKGADSTANDDRHGDAWAEEMPETQPRQSQTQLQVLTLLKSLNERLKATQAERNFMRRQLEEYRDIVNDLEKKSGKTEQNFHRLEQKFTTLGHEQKDESDTEEFIKDTLKEMESTRRLLLKLENKTTRAEENVSKTIVNYAQITKRLIESEDKQDHLSAKIDDALSQQERLTHKIDQTIEDRARFMRKIERIEETVIQTRDALNAKAMLLTEEQSTTLPPQDKQSLGGALLMQGQPETVLSPSNSPLKAIKIEKLKSFVHSILHTQAALIPGLFFLAIVAGLFIGKTQPPQAPGLGIEEIVQLKSAQDQESTITGAQNWQIEENTSAFSSANTLTPSFPKELEAVGLESDAQMLQMMEDNPKKLSKTLNKLEPGQAQEGVVVPMVIQNTTPATQNAVPYTPLQIDTKIASDPALPDVIKQVETQALNGSPEAQHDLAAIYIAGHGGVKQNYERAALWFRKAADQDIANAKYNLGVLYHQGLGVRTNLKEAIYWYEGAADLAHPEAQYNLGIAYIEGIGVPYLPAKAAQYFENAAKSNITEAAYNLGLIYENGLLGEARPDEALMWYKQAADKGSPEARAALEQLAKVIGISLDDVNRVAEDVRATKYGVTTPPTKAPPKAKAKAPVKSKDTIKAVKTAPKEASIAPIAAQSSNPLAGVEKEFEQILSAQIQKNLMRLGLYPGPADGIIGPLTDDAIRSYQKSYNLPVNGQISADLLNHISAQTTN